MLKTFGIMVAVLAFIGFMGCGGFGLLIGLASGLIGLVSGLFGLAIGLFGTVLGLLVGIIGVLLPILIVIGLVFGLVKLVA